MPESPTDPLGIDVSVTRLRVRKYRSGERPETHEPFEVLEIDPRDAATPGPTTDEGARP